MKQIIFLTIPFLIFACTSAHPDTYIYESQVYTSTEVSDFEVQHYQKYGNDNFLVLDDKESLQDTSRQRSIKTVCAKYFVTCKSVDLTKEEPQRSELIAAAYSQFEGKKFFVFSPNAEATAMFVGTINVLLHKGDKASIEGIFKELRLNEHSALQEEILELKASNRN